MSANASDRKPSASPSTNEIDAPHGNTVKEAFRLFSATIAHAVGHPLAFAIAVAVVVGWALTGPHFKYSDTWQLVINTGTTIVTFLMVFLIQNTQNRDSRAIHLKLDELIHGVRGARNTMVDLENCTDDEIARFEQEFHALRERHGVEPGSRERRKSRGKIDREASPPSK
ncbi:MAG: low affinity iron permease family protein [Anaerolineae bacterium]|nr:low affinity iron permease family protein [Phycisphaerae bacterium]